ncbi:lysoplasmalogenase [Caulobacter sp. SLTY]|uniref:lysoplasmalogenase n=1 Tax=Caulobacter sp. SLTY TaxID=2683262 RepID=UPI001F0F39D7|nr:lysoplasmalogenase [Caulobacter sp. SLTY]
MVKSASGHDGELTMAGMGYADFPTLLFGGALLFSPLAAILYGLVYSHRPPSAFRTVLKTSAVGILALLVFVNLAAFPGSEAARSSMILLGAGFALCAIGDAFLAGNPKRWLPPGLVAFLLGHVAFIVLFAGAAETRTLGPVIYAAMAVVALVGAGMLRWLWPHLGALRWPVVAYVVVIVVMVCEGLTHWSHNIAWAIGGLLFMASDAILAGQLFRSAKLPGPARLTDWAIWFLYYGAQVAFLTGAIAYSAKV